MKNGRGPSTSMAIADAQSVPNASSARIKGYDAGKKVSGIKRHIAVDTNGLPHGIHITPANETDRNGAVELFEIHKENLTSLEKVLVDGGYSGEVFASRIYELLHVVVEVPKRSELRKFVVMPQRWIVERSFSWLEKCRRLWRNCESLLSSSKAMVQLAFIRILLKRR